MVPTQWEHFYMFAYVLNTFSERSLGLKFIWECVPLGESASGFLICGMPFEQIHFQISDLSNPLWTRIYWITDLHNLKMNHWIIDPMRSFGQRLSN